MEFEVFTKGKIMNHLSRSFVTAIGAALMAGCANTPLETVYVPVNLSEWKTATVIDRRGTMTLVEFIPKDQAADSWERIFSIQFMENQHYSTTDWVKGLYQKVATICPTTKWAVIETDTFSTLYEWSVKDCPGQTDQYEIARILKGNDGLHRIAYVRHNTTMLTFDERELWIQNLKSGYVVKGDSGIPEVIRP
jgi:hypothetical protein